MSVGAAAEKLPDRAVDAPVDAVVLVGGKGTRLRPLTLSAPKQMLPTAGVPFLTHLFSRIRAAGIHRIVVSTSYMAETFERYFGDGSALGVELVYVVEEEPLDTGGAIRNVAGELRGEDVLVFNGDVLSGADLGAVLETHRGSAADATLHLVKVSDPSRFGCVPTDADGRVTAFLEKTPDPPTDQINAGCYVFRRSVVDAIPAGRRVSVERETFPGLLDSGAHLQAHVDSTYWLDVGTPEAFVRGSADLVLGVAPSAAVTGVSGEALRLPGCEVAADAEVRGGSAVGAGAKVGARSRVDGAVLFDNAVVAEDALVRRSVIGAGATVGAGAVVCDAVIGDGAVVGAGCELQHGARVWPGVRLPDGGIRFSTDA
jgi:mannose-1-phosphate guanylyltransferase